jgi:hypothetical protein
MKKNPIYLKVFLSIIIFAIFQAKSTDQCDTICNNRIELFIQKHATPLINSIGSQLGITMPLIKGDLTRKITVFDSALIFFAMLFGADQNMMQPINSNESAALKMQTTKENAASLYFALSQKNPSANFMNYSFLPISTHTGAGTITFENKSNNPWQICCLSSTQQTYETINAGSTKSIKTELPQFYLYLDYKQKQSNRNAGTWFNPRLNYNGESYTFTDENNLVDNSTEETIAANKPIVSNVINAL